MRASVEGQVLHFPIPKPDRIAVIDMKFRPERAVRCFALDEMPWVRAWQPHAIVLPLGQALMLADQKRRGLFDLPSLNTALVVLTSFEDSPLVPHHRDLLWQAFGLPIFEQLLSAEGRVIASECEIHDGLHLRDTYPGQFTSDLVNEHCACGLETPRLRAPRSLKARAAAGF